MPAVNPPKIVYRFHNGLYVNPTNRCPVSCVFCIKHRQGMNFRGDDLDLKGAEPDAEEIKALIEKEWREKPFSELVFCGYGEPVLRLPVLIDICRAIRKNQAEGVPADLKIRLNTSGLGSLIWNRDIVPELKENFDSVHISLNTAAPAQWEKLMQPCAEYRDRGHEGVLAFIASCAGNLPETVVTAVEIPGMDTAAVKKLAEILGAGFRIRPLL
ncbi:MAG: TatD family nuclease-associated radical SAM protein [bacterium]